MAAPLSRSIWQHKAYRRFQALWPVRGWADRRLSPTVTGNKLC